MTDTIQIPQTDKCFTRKPYELLVTVGLILYIIQDYLSESLVVPDIISRSVFENCVIATTCIFMLAIIYALVCGYYSVKELAIILCCVVVVLLVEKQYDHIETLTVRNILINYRLLSRLIVFVALRKMDFRKICLTVFIVSSVVMGYIVAQRYLGRVPDKYFYDETRSGSPYRYNLGFSSFAVSSIRYINIFFTGVYSIDKSRKKGVPLWLLAAFVLWGRYFYDQTQTRLAYTIILTGAFMYVLVRKVDPNLFVGKEKIVKLVLSGGFFAAPLSICLVSLLVKPQSSFYSIANKLLSGRIRLNYRALTEYPITPFGVLMQMITDNAENYFYVDSGYIRSLIEFGFLLFAIMIFLYARLSKNATKQSESFLVCWLLLMCIYNLFNNLFANFAINSVLLAFWTMYDSCDLERYSRTELNDPKKTECHK